MAIEVRCVRCGEELEEPGALLFSPPGWPWSMVDKFHLCVSCFRWVLRKVRDET